MLESFDFAVELIREAKGCSENEGSLVGHLDEAEMNLIRAREKAEQLLKAAQCALGHLTGNMDGDMDLGDPVKILREAISGN